MIDDNDDNEDTPPRHIVTERSKREHFATYPPGTPVVADLVEHDLQQRVQVLERGQREQRIDVESLLASRRFWRWCIGLGAPAMLSAIFVVTLYSADKIASSSERAGETRARIEALDNLIKLLQTSIDQLRQHAGLAPLPDSSIPRPVDKMSWLPDLTKEHDHALVSRP